MNRQYPRLVLRDSSFRSNARETISRCAACGIQVCGVIKGVNGLPEVARRFRECGVTQLGTSRLEQVERCRQAGIPGPYLLIRIPGPTELPELVRLCEMSLQSERKTLDLLEQECTRQEKPHAVIIMADLGDLREGYWDHEEMVQTCLYVERRLPHVHLSGVGVNLSCYGSVRATPEKMQMLLAIARRVEDAIGRPLEIVSGGATSSYPMIHTGTMPAGINHLRIGENILTAQDIADSWGVHDADYLRDDVFRLEAEVVEVKEKPTYPQGELGADAFGRKPVYEDRGLRLRAILALGRADVGDMETLRPTMPGVTVIGLPFAFPRNASSSEGTSRFSPLRGLLSSCQPFSKGSTVRLYRSITCFSVAVSGSAGTFARSLRNTSEPFLRVRVALKRRKGVRARAAYSLMMEAGDSEEQIQAVWMKCEKTSASISSGDE